MYIIGIPKVVNTVFLHSPIREVEVISKTIKFSPGIVNVVGIENRERRLPEEKATNLRKLFHLNGEIKRRTGYSADTELEPVAGRVFPGVWITLLFQHEDCNY